MSCLKASQRVAEKYKVRKHVSYAEAVKKVKEGEENMWYKVKKESENRRVKEILAITPNHTFK